MLQVVSVVGGIGTNQQEECMHDAVFSLSRHGRAAVDLFIHGWHGHLGYKTKGTIQFKFGTKKRSAAANNTHHIPVGHVPLFHLSSLSLL